MSRIIDGKALAADYLERLRAEVKEFHARTGRPPGLHVLVVGEDPASHIYVNKKRQTAAELGFFSKVTALSATTPESELLQAVYAANAAESVDGILVQMPLPAGLAAEKILAAVDPQKDVDGFHPENVGRLALGEPRFVPCTPLGIMRMLAAIGVEPAGRHAVVIGRSRIVGRPMAMLLLQADATVTICHSQTRDLPGICRHADILVAAVGRPGLVRGSWIRPGAVVIDVGMNRTPQGLCGDVHQEEARAVADWLTPVPGGVGPMTIAMLLHNTLQAARMRKERTS
jgi:methylenetetrahydrofolate dehydrogenase (NADP+)/methenyltetrahydrofolate cyclohydrolase